MTLRVVFDGCCPVTVGTRLIRKALLEIERKYPDAWPVRKLLLAEAQTLIDAVKIDRPSSGTSS
jgi:hypothetical protein